MDFLAGGLVFPRSGLCNMGRFVYSTYPRRKLVERDATFVHSDRKPESWKALLFLAPSIDPVLIDCSRQSFTSHEVTSRSSGTKKKRTRTIRVSYVEPRLTRISIDVSRPRFRQHACDTSTNMDCFMTSSRIGSPQCREYALP